MTLEMIIKPGANNVTLVLICVVVLILVRWGPYRPNDVHQLFADLAGLASLMLGTHKVRPVNSHSGRVGGPRSGCLIGTVEAP